MFNVHFLGKLHLGCVVKTKDGVDIEIRSLDSIISRVVNISQIAATCGALSACGQYCAVLTGKILKS